MWDKQNDEWTPETVQVSSDWWNLDGESRFLNLLLTTALSWFPQETFSLELLL